MNLLNVKVDVKKHKDQIIFKNYLIKTHLGC